MFSKISPAAQTAPFSTLVDWLSFRARSQPRDVVYTFLSDGERDAQHLPFAELWSRARAIAAQLSRRGAAGERALLLYQPGLDFPAALFGCFLAGVIAVPEGAPDPRRPERGLRRLQAIAADARARFVLTSLALRPLQAQAPPELSHAEWIATDVPTDSALAAAEGAPSPDSPACIDASAPAYLQYTSGSTADPKGVVLTHAHLVCNCEQLNASYGLGSDSVTVSWVPTFHDLGLLYSIAMPILTGSRCVLFGAAHFVEHPIRWLRAISRHRGTHSVAPNTAFDLAVQKTTADERAGLDLRSWRVLLNGAEPIYRDSEESFIRTYEPYGFKRDAISHALGMAEATAMVSAEPPGQRMTFVALDAAALARHEVREVPMDTPGARVVAGCGVPARDTRFVAVEPETQRILPEDQVGELWLSGPAVGAGYWNKPAATAETFANRLRETGEARWLRTGDLGFLRDGQVFVVGRLKDMIIVCGKNHHAEDLEGSLRGIHPALRPGAAVAFSVDARPGEQLVLVAEVKAEQPLDAEPIHAAMRAALAEHGLRPAALLLVPPGTIPKTTSGKLQRRRTRALFQSNALPTVSRWDAQPAGFRLRIGQAGHLESLVRAPHRAPLPAAGEVQVELRAAGLNFRDVLSALDLYPGDADVLGQEGAGIVRAVGEEVRDLRPGDRVLGLVPGAFADSATVDRRLLVKLPETWSFVEGAALPVAFLTGWHGLVTLAGLRRGERVLVHAAAGGVGMAALQIARLLGAEIFATASPTKWPALRALGLDDAHLGSSRDARFAEKFPAVDVVLNCLTGELVDASLRLLAEGGRFIELGKRDRRSDAEIAATCSGITYRAFDLLEVGADVIARMLATLLAHFQSGALRHLPVRPWPMEEAAEAFRFMARARHQGKIVLTPASESAAAAQPVMAPASEPDSLGIVQREIARVLDLPQTERVAPDEPLQARGLDSLMAAELCGRLARHCGKRIEPGALLRLGTPRRIAEALLTRGTGPQEAERPVVAAAIAPRPIVAPLSAGQARLYFLDRLLARRETYNLHLALHIAKVLDAERLQEALDAIVARHEPLRTCFFEREGSPVQRVLPWVQLTISRFDLRGDGTRRDDSLQRLASQQATAPFDLGAGPLLRVGLVQLGSAGSALLLTWHHIIADGWSVGIFLRELSAAYAALSSGCAIDEAAPLPYRLYVERAQSWLHGAAAQEQRRFWRQQLEGVQPLDLAVERPADRAPNGSGASHAFALEAELSSALESLARRSGSTPFVVLLAGWAALLRRYSGQDDFTIGIVTSGRDEPALHDVIGFFANTLPLRCTLSGVLTVRRTLALLGERVWAALEHQALPLDEILRSGSGIQRDGAALPPLLRIGFVLEERAWFEQPFAGAACVPLGKSISGDVEGTTKFDLALALARAAGGYQGLLTYDAALFRAETIAHMAEHLRQLIRQMSERPDAGLAELTMLTALERERLAAPSTPPEREALLIHEMFEQHAAAGADAAALDFAGRLSSYGALNARANQLSHLLREHGIGLEQRVGLYLGRGVEMVASILAVLKAGAAYVPLDPSYPVERLRYMAEDAGLSMMITRGPLPEQLAWQGAVIDLAKAASAISAQPIENPPRSAAPEGLAYVIYTSGSTGQPKGVAVPHRGLPNMARARADWQSITPGKRVLAYASFSFDAAVFEVLGALAAGACVVLTSDDERSAGTALARRLADVDAAVLPPAVLSALVPEALPPQLDLAIAGEQCAAADAARFTAARSLLNLYGPTEATVWTTAWRSRAKTEHLPLGRPIAQTRVCVLDADLQLAPPGVAGEIYIAGVGLARGYLDRPALTASRFVPDPFGPPGSRMYRTGDIGRLRSDGDLEFLGRVDQQIKLRGFRIELGEIEAHLCAYPGVRQCAVSARKDDAGELRLVAYVVSEPPVAAAALREHLGAVLPAYMIPATFVRLSALPLGANGKVDRQALPAPPSAQTAGAELGAPRTPTEAALAQLWSQLLGVEGAGASDSFFELGGDSLRAMKLASRIRSVFGVELPLRALFEAPALAAQAALIDAADRGAAGRPIAVLDRAAQRLPLSFAQERLLFLEELQPGTALYNIPMALRLRGALDVTALATALDHVCARHEVLRVLPGAEAATRLHESRCGSGLTVEELEDEAVLGARINAEAQRPFDLVRGPLLRAKVWRLSPQHHALLLCVHHIVFDDGSASLLFRELSASYEALVAGRPLELPPLPIQYADFAAWQRSAPHDEAIQRMRDEWRSTLAGAPRLDLPTDHPRPAMQPTRGAWLPLTFDPVISAELDGLARSKHMTPFMLLLAAFGTLLSRYSGQHDVIIGTPIGGRDRAELEGLIGLFVNLLALRLDLSADPTVDELLGRVRGTTLSAYARRSVPFEQVVHALGQPRDPSRTPLFQVMLVLRDGREETPQLGGLAVEALPVETSCAKFDLTLHLEQTAHGLRGGFEYCTQLFSADTIARMAGHLRTLVGQMIRFPQARLSQLEMLSEQERLRMPAPGSGSAEPSPPAPVHGLFEQQVLRTPHRTALAHADEALSYAALNARANQLAHLLRARGVGLEDRVGLYLERCPDMIVALLAVLKAGGAYVPLDPSYPAERLQYMVQDAGLSVLITRGIRAAELATDARTLDLLAEADEVARMPQEDPGVAVAPEGLAYVLYTSGSTGRPKGVCIHHRGFANYARWALDAYEGLRGVVLSHLAAGFDAAITTQVLPLLAGGQVRLLPDSEGGAALVDALRADTQEVTLLKLTPTHLSLLIEQGVPLPPSALVVLGGESLPAALLNAALALGPVRGIVNEYGPTETVVGCAVHRRAEAMGEASVPIGRAIANMALYVLGPDLTLAPPGVPGEIYIAGVGLSRGYLNCAALTASRFVPDPFGPPGSRMYRTGDIGRLRPDGDLEFLGRIDQQIKLRGFRIELGEIEANLSAHPDVAHCAVVLRRDGGAEARLVAYVVTERCVTTAELREHLASTLPAYMVPAIFVRLPALPLTENGKVNRKALPAPERVRAELATRYEAPRTDPEAALAEIFASVLGVKEVGIHDSFFELGGDSILTLQVVRRAARAAIAITARQIFEHQTVAALAAVAAPVPGAAPAISPTPDAAVPLTPIQRWFFAQRLPVEGHYNQAICVQIPARYSAAVLRAALQALVTQHDALRLVFCGMSASPAACPDPVPVQELDLSQRTEEAARDAQVQLAATELQRSMRTDDAPLLRALRIDLGSGGARLLCVVHHLAVDAVSWQVLLEDLERACEAILDGKPVQLEATASWQQWALSQQALAKAGTLGAARPFWLATVTSAVTPLRVRPPAASRAHRSTVIRLTAAHTEALLRQAGRAYRTEITDLLLSALVTALRSWLGGDAFGVVLEGHGREEALNQDLDVSRTVGWFTTMFPVRFDLAGIDAQDIGGAIQRIKKQLHAVPHKGASYGVLRWLAEDGDQLALPRRGFDVLFNYLGQLRRGQPGLGADAHLVGECSAAANPLPALLCVNGLVIDGVLEMRFEHDAQRFAPGAIEQLAAAWQRRIEEIVSHCAALATPVLTPSDVPLAALDQATLDRLCAARPGLVDLYPATPMQSEMLAQALVDPRSTANFEQLYVELCEDIDEAAFEAAFAEVVARYPTLRTALVWRDLPRPLQAVRGEVRIDWQRVDWQAELDSDASERLASWLADDRARGFDLERAPLLRMAWLRHGPTRRHWVFSFHHLILDGWSLQIVLGEVLKLYNARCQRVPVRLPPPAPYRRYVEWLESREPTADAAFWRQALAGLRAPFRLREHALALDAAHKLKGLPDRQQEGQDEHVLQLDEVSTRALQQLAREQHLTLNTVLQGAWALLLSGRSQRDDVCFGVIVSGRRPEVAGIEQMAGLCINTLPLRARLRPEATLGTWLAELQERHVRSREHDALPLSAIERLVGLPAGTALFDTLMVFENYPLDETLAGSALAFSSGRVDMFEQTPYPLTVTVVPAQTLRIILTGDRKRFTAAALDALARELGRLLSAMATSPHTPLGKLQQPPKPHLPRCADNERAATGRTPMRASNRSIMTHDNREWSIPHEPSR